MHPAFSSLSKFGVLPDDDDETRLQKLILIITSLSISIAAIIWGLIYIWFGEVQAGLIPLFYAGLSMLSLLVLKISKIFRLYRFSQMVLILLLPFLVIFALGGFINGSGVILWSLLAPLGALLSGQKREARYWFFGFLALVFLSGILQPFMREQNNLPGEVINLFFILNIGTVSFITFLVLNYFVKQKNEVIAIVRKNRELEVSQLQQEVMLRQSEKLATLGRLSAGIAHELNNPATAGLRGAKQLQEIISDMEKYLFRIGQMDLSDRQLEIFKAMRDQIDLRSRDSAQPDPLTLSDLENDLEAWLENKNIDDPWKYSSMLAKSGFNSSDLSDMAKNFSGKSLSDLIAALWTIHLSQNLLDEISQGTGRITEIVKSLKSYSYQDEAPLQSLDIHEGLNNTLIMLRSQLKKGITVQREYDQNLPRIQGYGNELSQVWTNIIDNAITAMNGQGKITIKTFSDKEWVVIRISDTGQGIPEEIQARIFDPFFTTKPPGEGTGLGLNISRNIIVQRHGGKIKVESHPGETCFEIKLPIKNDIPKADQSELLSSENNENI